MEKKLTIKGMMCEHCEKRVKKALEAVNGVKSADIDLTQGTALVKGENLQDGLLKAAVEAADYQVIDIR